MRLSDVEVGADVAVPIAAGGAIAGGRIDIQPMGDTTLPQHVPRSKKTAAVGAGHNVGVAVLGAVRDAMATGHRATS